MTRKSHTIFLLAVICVTFTATVSEITRDPTLCSRTKCKALPSRKFKYEENVSYRYRYSVDVSTNLGRWNASRTAWPGGQARNESTLRLDADLVVRFTSRCEGSLKFENASLSHEPGKYNREFPDRAGAEFKADLERYAVRFAFDDGCIDELCPDRRDPIWAVNLKRGVLSLMQNTMHRLDVDRRVNELDVHGVCETTYRLHEARRTSLIVKKTKDLTDCVHGSKYFSVIRSNVYRSPRSGFRGPRHPVLESRSECELTIDRNIYEKIVCTDSHRLQPLSSGDTGPRTESTSFLRLTGETRNEVEYYGQTDAESDGPHRDEGLETEEGEEEQEEEEEEGQDRNRVRRSNLLYDYTKTPRTVHGELRTSRDRLKQMCGLGLSPDELQQRFSETFTAFVQSARLLDYPSLSQLFFRANGICEHGKRHIVNALPFMSSNAAVSLMRYLIANRYVDETTLDKWVIAFALIPRPNRETIRALYLLLPEDRRFPDAQIVLSYSATIYAFCTNHETRCNNVKEVNEFLAYLEGKIEEGCAAKTHSPATIKRTLEALKAVGNTGLETDRLLERLKACIDDRGGFLPMEIRVTAIDAHRRMASCEETRDRYFLNYYRNFTLDAEIRIASYLQVMRCPDYGVVKTIKHTLKLEEVNQVGTFVWSHLTNLYNSASPTRVEIQSLLTDRDLDGKFNADRRKFSRNYDGSFFSEEYNFGANYQANLIFSPRSYIPRTATFNLTFDLFGESVNVFEATTRLEGFEYYAEKFFGPDGPYSNEKVSGFFHRFLRNFRAAPDEREDYWKRAKRIPNVIDNNFDEPKISFGYRIFGNDLKYTMMSGDRAIREALKRMDPWEKFKQLASGQEIRYENAIMFLDSTYVVPMTSGLPIRLDFAGSAACDFKMSGLLDTRGISKGEVELVSNVSPSVSVDVVGSMTVDAFHKTAGTKLRTNVYSSGAVQIHLDVKGLRRIRLSLGLPNKRMEVFSIGTDIVFTRGNGAALGQKPVGVLIAGRTAEGDDANDEDALSTEPLQRPVPEVPSNVISDTSCTWSALDRLVGLKLCLDYQLTNVTKDPSAPYFVLSGPTLFKISLHKADPTAKNYLLEYKWEKTELENVFRLAFDTPGSRLNRESSAMISFHAKTHNVTVLLRSAGNSLVAEGTYKSTENETFVDLGFDINGTKHLDASFGYAIKRFHYGYTFSPQMHLIVNNERIAALSGTIRNAWKNNVSQCDVDLTFRTKRVWSKLVGYIVRRNVSLASDFQLDYQLQKMPKKETLRLVMSISNRSSKSFTHKAADLVLRSASFPQLNTVITAWYQQALGHLELHAEVNSGPYLTDNRHKLTAKLIVSYSKMYFQNRDTKVSMLLAVTKPIQKLDIKIGINHYVTGPESKSGLLIGYAPGKEIRLTVKLLKPRGPTFSLEAHANLTIPSFDSMLIDARISERTRRTYDLDVAGTWFSGHNVTARGTYSDRSVATALDHGLKLILKSPSFLSDVLVNCKLHRNYSDIGIVLHVEQVDRDRYAFILNHTVVSPTSILSYVEGRYKGSVYSLTSDVDTEREVRMEIHLDKWRDVHFTLSGVNGENGKSFGAELKWDANRDPALKLAVLFNLERTYLPLESNVSTAVTLSYPGRFVVLSCHLTARNLYDYIVDGAIDWSPEQTIKLFIATRYDEKLWIKLTSLETRLITPFENWRKTGLSFRYGQEWNKIKACGAVYWRDSQRMVAELDGSADVRDNAKEWKGNYGLISTVQSMPSITVNVTHRFVDSQIADTRLWIRYDPDNVIDAWSIWYLDKLSENVFNLTGNLHLESPVTRYRRSDMKCQLQILPDWKIFGAANVDLDKRTYTGKLIGDLARLKESMLQFNVTTPLETCAFVRGRFGLSETNKHVVAEVVTPSGPIGFEALCRLFTVNYEFDVRLLLATPLEAFQRSLLVAKLNDREADFRIAYNTMLAGFQAIRHNRGITDFHYSYRLFTPLAGLEECGIVAKLIVSRVNESSNGNANLDVDAEFSGRLSEVKVGVTVRAGPKPRPVVIEIGSTAAGLANGTSSKMDLEDSSSLSSQRAAAAAAGDDDDDEEEEEEESELHWHGEVELCAAIIEPIVGLLDIDNQGPTYTVAGILEYFQGKIVLDDTFFIKDLFNMKNELNIALPFELINEIACSNAFLVDMETSRYTVRAAVNVKRNETWHDTSLDASYVYGEGEDDDSQTHELRLHLRTPLQSLRYLETNTSLEIQRNFYRFKVRVRAPRATIDFHGSYETEPALLDTTLVLEIDTPMVRLPRTSLTVKRDYTEEEKYVKIAGEIAEPAAESFSVQMDWYATEDRGKAYLVFDCSIESLRNIEAGASYWNAIPTNDTASLVLYAKRSRDRYYKLSGNYTTGMIEAELYTPYSSGKPRYALHGDLTRINDTAFEFQGELWDLAAAKMRIVSGNVEITRAGYPRTLQATILPKVEAEDRTDEPISIRLERERYGLNAALTSRWANGTVDANLINRLNWDARLALDIVGQSGQTDRVRVSTFTNVQVNGNTTLYVHAETPLTEIRNVSLSGSALLANDSGDIRASGWWSNDRSRRAILQWKLAYMVDMFGRVLFEDDGRGTSGQRAKFLEGQLYFRNPGRVFRNVDVGFDLDVDREAWKLAANATIGFRNHENIDGVFAVRLPPPDDDDHRFLVSYHANGGIRDASYVIGYNAQRAKRNYATDGSVHTGPRHMDGHVRASWGILPIESINNLMNVSFDNKEIRVKYSLYTPKYRQQETLSVLFDYDGTLDEKTRAINADIYCPGSTRIASANVSYESLTNVNGTINAMLPLANVSQLGCEFTVFTTLQRNKRYVKLLWPRNTAILDSDYNYRSEKLNSDLEGVLHAEVPLNTRHIGHLTYGYKKRPQMTNGFSDLTYNGQKVVHGEYNSKSESRAGFERDRIEIAIENAYKPIGVLYINQYEYSAGYEGTNYPTVEFKHVNLYRLDNRTAFNVIGESRIETTHTGQNVHLKAMHANKTVQLRTDFEVLPGEFSHTSWLSLSEHAWISYRFNVSNKTTEDVDNQFLVFTVSYPRRHFTLDGSYWISRDQFKSEARLDWDRETDTPRTVGALFSWANLTTEVGTDVRQRAMFALKHPSLSKMASVKVELLNANPRLELLNVLLTADYSTDPNKLFALSTSLTDEAPPSVSRRYAYRLTGNHPSTRFHLNVRGFAQTHASRLFEMANKGMYKRSFSMDDQGQLNARLDLALDELLYHREYNEQVKYLYVRYRSFDRRYTVNGSIVNTPHLNATGAFLFDPRELLTWMMLNYTPDAVESMRMYGRIPDARNAVFDIWRTYEDDFSISDVSFYLKLNHSRLITSTLRWRPDLNADIIAFLKKTALEAYEGTINDIEEWKRYAKSETVNVISDVWDDAQQDLEAFLADWNNLKELQTDLEELKIYLNDSYNANDFYIKDIVTFGMHVIDELALRSRIESLPNIVNEVWEVMGESGEAIRNSLLSVIEMMKNALNKVSEIVVAIVRGDSIAQVSSIIEKLLERYDKFVRDLHVSFIRYIESLWDRIARSISQQWNRFLLLVEPLFIRFAHYLDTVVWKAGKEFVDFLYDRRNDLISSPYFDRFSNFTQDIDKFYRDIKSNDIVTNVQKYSTLVVRFLKDRYFKFVPFGKELKDVVDEIVGELKELQKLPTIRYASEKIQRLYDKVCHVFEYLEIRAKMESAIRLVHSKLMDISQTALQAENRYREAKTKFILDPNQGLMCLEQKLPMSWHAFNQTPEFHEIPEFRAITKLKSYFASSNVTFWSLYRYRPYIDPHNWLPPFKAQAMIVGSRHFITFDGRHLDFVVGPCTYLLARDFVRDTFTILLEYRPRDESRVTHKIVMLFGREALELDIFDDTVKLVSEGSALSAANNLALPIELENGTTYVYQTESVITVERKRNQLRLECNLKYDYCTLELSGWYHGKTAGILGTMNYEPMDDTTASNGIPTEDVRTFAESWSIDRYVGADCRENISGSAATSPAAKSEEDSKVVSLFCHDLFLNKSSEFVSCFDMVEPAVYGKMCTRSASKSEACTVALSYMQVCAFHHTYLRIPDVCSSCATMDDDQLAEGQFEKLQGDRVPSSTDVVFIVEGKECNRGIRENRSIEQLVSQLSKEFRDQRLTDNRWSLVVFGADGVFDQPRSVVLGGQIFTKNVARYIDYFDHVPIGNNGNRDVFAAIAFATKLVFRPGVSKTFVLMPCSHCEPENQTLDYSVLHEVLLEHDVRLHILMDGDFEFEKDKLNKIFYGLDATKSYTKKDARTLTGDVDLRRQVKLSKTALGYCTPLTLEINGTIFSGDKLRFDNSGTIKKFVSVFAKRVALTAQPNPCQNCECTSDNNGVTRMECIPCVYPTPISVDYDTFNLNDSLTSLQPLNIDYGLIDIDDS